MANQTQVEEKTEALESRAQERELTPEELDGIAGGGITEYALILGLVVLGVWIA